MSGHWYLYIRFSTIIRCIYIHTHTHFGELGFCHEWTCSFERIIYKMVWKNIIQESLIKTKNLGKSFRKVDDGYREISSVMGEGRNR